MIPGRIAIAELRNRSGEDAEKEGWRKTLKKAATLSTLHGADPTHPGSEVTANRCSYRKGYT